MLLVGLKLGFIYPDSELGLFTQCQYLIFYHFQRNHFIPCRFLMLYLYSVSELWTPFLLALRFPEITLGGFGSPWYWSVMVESGKLEPLHTPSPSFWPSVIPVQDFQLLLREICYSVRICA